VSTADSLDQRLGALVERVVADPRWLPHRDDLGLAVLGMLLYGYALAMGRILFFMDVADIDAAVVHVLGGRLGASPKWSSGLVAAASRAAFDKGHHPGHHELIAVGHSYLEEADPAKIADNVLANLERMRARTGARG
jgi:hypothetical protein